MLELGGGVMRIEDTIGRAIFDGTERMFHVTDTLSCTVSIPSIVSGVGASAARTSTTVLGSCNAAATHLIGAFRVTFPGSSNPSGVPGFGWFAAGGTYIHWFDGSTFTTGGYANNPLLKDRINAWGQYTPKVAGGQFLLDEQVYIFGYTSGGAASTYTQFAFTMECRFKAGLFTI